MLGRQAIDIDQRSGAHDVELHQIKHRGATRDELNGCGRRRRSVTRGSGGSADRSPGVVGTAVGEGAHSQTFRIFGAACSIAATMCG